MTGNSVSFAHPAITQAKIVLIGPTGALFHRIIDSVRSLQESEPISTDELIRQEVEKGSANSVALAKSLETDSTAADDQVLGILRRWFWSRKSGKGFVITGFPANKAQASVFDEWLEDRNEGISACLVIRQSEEDALREAQECHKCPVDGRRFYTGMADTLSPGNCDSCGAELIPIPDEARAEVRSWFALRSAGARSLLDYYRDRGLLTVLVANEFSQDGGANVHELLDSLIVCA